jgi:hypothetical protein
MAHGQGGSVMSEPTSKPTGAAPGGLVEVSRSGGFAGMTAHGRVNLDRLAGDDLAAWQSALSEGLAGAAPGGQPAPDRFVYRVRNRTSGLDVTVGEQDLAEPLRALLDSAVRPPP